MSNNAGIKPLRTQNTQAFGKLTLVDFYLTAVPSDRNPGGVAGVFILWPIPAINRSIRFQVEKTQLHPPPTHYISDLSVQSALQNHQRHEKGRHAEGGRGQDRVIYCQMCLATIKNPNISVRHQSEFDLDLMSHWCRNRRSSAYSLAGQCKYSTYERYYGASVCVLCMCDFLPTVTHRVWVEPPVGPMRYCRTFKLPLKWDNTTPDITIKHF